MKYVHKKTGAVIETTSRISGSMWEAKEEAKEKTEPKEKPKKDGKKK